MIRSLVLLLLANLPLTAAPPTIELADGGKARHQIIVAEKAAKQTRANAATLADQLGAISGAKFEVATGDGTTGIAFGSITDFPTLTLGVDFQPRQTTRREEYLLRTHPKGLYLIGATDLGAQHAMWDLLHRVGYRQFFPGKTWEVVPSVPKLSISVDATSAPSYHSRRIWYGYGAWDYAKEPYRDWCEKNRTASGVDLNTGHAYDGLVSGLKVEFERNPDWWPMLKGERKPVRNPKPCLGNPAVREALVRQSLKKFDANPNIDSISVDPSDGGGWCECPKCAKLGSVTDQAITLANEVAEALEKKAPGRLVGIYAYNYHSPPPSVAVHPNVVVSVATAFIKGGQTLDEILNGWAAKKTTLGIREYYSVNVWDRDLPGHTRGGNLAYLQRTIPEFHTKGARFMSAESSDNWGPNGLGYYFASRMLWDVNEAKNKDAIVADFLEKAFGRAKEPMAEFYRQIDGANPHLVADDQLARMYRALDAARKLADTPAVRKRLDDLTLYTRYVSLYQRYAMSEPKNRQATFEDVIRFAYRMRTTMMIHSLALYRDLPNRDKTVTVPSDAKFNVPAGRNPWKNDEPFATTDIAQFVTDGLANHKPVELDFKPVAYGGDLVPIAKLKPPTDKPPGEFGIGRGVQTFHTFTGKAETLELKITGGLIAHYRDRGNVKIEVWKLGGASQTGEKETLVATDRSTPPDGKEYTVKLPLKEAGVYKVTISDGQDRTSVVWPTGLPQVVLSTQDQPINKTYTQWMAYFYVPKGTKVIGFFGGEHGEIRDSEDRPQFWLNGRANGFYSCAVPEGQDGKVWKVRFVRGTLRMLTVPPSFARTPQELLLPKEVVEKDAK
ncbi:MAG: DUF4838 domain-containing protein [Gemmataceae bacterium]|nr:DUF4838 domain-containing protein [Gemmataceae bacterium]